MIEILVYLVIQDCLHSDLLGYPYAMPINCIAIAKVVSFLLSLMVCLLPVKFYGVGLSLSQTQSRVR